MDNLAHIWGYNENNTFRLRFLYLQPIPKLEIVSKKTPNEARPGAASINRGIVFFRMPVSGAFIGKPKEKQPFWGYEVFRSTGRG